LSRRVLIYSHDTVGLGHIRRCLALAGSLAQRIDDLSVLVVTGSAAASSFSLPPRVDLLKLPGVRKITNGHYAPRSLDGEPGELRALRSGILRETLKVFAPSLIYVDKEPLGPLGELADVLEENRAARRAGNGATTLLGIRDILDDPESVRREWRERGTADAIGRLYDRVLVYGMREIFDLGREYGFPESLTRKIEYLGYIDPRERDGQGHAESHDGAQPKRVVVTAGGGEDGLFLFTSYLHAARTLETRRPLESTLVLGPDFPAGALESLELLSNELTHRVYIVRFAEDMAYYVRNADLVVSMAGYNTISEILAYGKHALVVPRVEPRREQLVRAERLARLGLVSFVHPAALTATSFSEAIARALDGVDTPLPPATVDLRGLERTASLVSTILEKDSERTWLRAG